MMRRSSTSRAPEGLAPRVAALVAIGLAVVVFSAGLAGCGSQNIQVAEFAEFSRATLDSLTTGLVAVRNPLGQPLSSGGDMRKALTAFRKTIAENQSKLDESHPSTTCLELSRLIGGCIDSGRDAGDVSSQFADYLAQVAPLAQQVSETVDTISKLPESSKTPYGMVGLLDKSRQYLASFQSMNATSAFAPVHQRFGLFLQQLNYNLERASGVAPSELPQEPTTPDENSATRQTTPSTRSNRSSNAADDYLGAIPGDWAQANQEIAELFQGVEQSTGYKHQNDVFDAAVVTAQARLRELTAEYHLKTSK